jgi:hypothetical protein
MTDEILGLIGGKPSAVQSIRVSSKLRRDLFSNSQTVGVWDLRTNTIVILRDQLKTIGLFAGTLIHESLHAASGASDVSRSFEHELTEAIGKICDKHFSEKKQRVNN